MNNFRVDYEAFAHLVKLDELNLEVIKIPENYKCSLNWRMADRNIYDKYPENGISYDFSYEYLVKVVAGLASVWRWLGRS